MVLDMVSHEGTDVTFQDGPELPADPWGVSHTLGSSFILVMCCLLASCQVEPACSLSPSPLGRRVMEQQLTRDTPNSHLMLISC